MSVFDKPLFFEKYWCLSPASYYSNQYICGMTGKSRGKGKTEKNCTETHDVWAGVNGEVFTVTKQSGNRFGRKSVCATPSMETVQHNCTPQKQVRKLYATETG